MEHIRKTSLKLKLDKASLLSVTLLLFGSLNLIKLIINILLPLLFEDSNKSIVGLEIYNYIYIVIALIVLIIFIRIRIKYGYNKVNLIIGTYFFIIPAMNYIIRIAITFLLKNSDNAMVVNDMLMDFANRANIILFCALLVYVGFNYHLKIVLPSSLFVMLLLIIVISISEPLNIFVLISLKSNSIITLESLFMQTITSLGYLILGTYAIKIKQTY